MNECDVLVVDDDRIFLTLVRRRLRDAGITLETFDAAEPALAGFRARPARLLLVDLRLAGTSGTALLATLAADSLLGATRACLVTASMPDAHDLADIRRLGAELVLKQDVLVEGAIEALLAAAPGPEG